MKIKNLMVIALMSATMWVQAQITVTNTVFPAAGDTLKTASDLNPQGITVTAPGGPYTWDYSNLTASTRQSTVYQPAANGTTADSFPNADLVVIGDLGEEAYFDITATAFLALGVSGSDLGAGLPIETDVVFNPPVPELNTPLTFPNVFNSHSQVVFAISTDAIPGEILDSLGIPTGFLDSIRLRLDIIRSDFVDGYGTAKIPGGTYDVLRQKRTEISDTRIEIHVPFLGWQDVTALIGVEGFGQDTINSYMFISNTAKEPIAVLVMDSTGVTAQEVDYKDNGIASSVGHVLAERADVVVSPNPVSSQATFELKNILPGDYALFIFDVNGTRVLAKKLNSIKELVSLESLSNGTYLFQIVDNKNRIHAAGQLLKVNP